MFRVGTNVTVSFGSGTESGKTGVVVERSEIKTNGRGVPLLEGYFSPVNWEEESAIRLRDGRLITMFDDRLV